MADEMELTDGIPQESQEPPAPVEAPAEEAAIETLPYRVKDQERQLRADALQALAEDLGYDNPAAVINQLRNGQEAAEIYREAREMFKRSRAQQAQPQPDAYYQEQEARRAQQYQAPRQQPQYRQPEAEADDPLALIRAMNARLAEVDQRTAEVSQFVQWQRQQAERDFYEREQALRQEANTEYAKFASELKKAGVPEHKIPDREYLLEEAESMGMFGGRLPVGDIYRRTYKMIYGDDIAQDAVRVQMAKLRDPRARVAVPTGPASTPAPRQQANPIDAMTLKDILPEGKY